MNEFTLHADTAYKLAEQKAAQYFASLFTQVKNRSYAPALTADFHLWKKSHIHHHSWLSFFAKPKEPRVCRLPPVYSMAELHGKIK